MKKLYSVISIVLAIVLFVIAMFLNRESDYTDANTADKCAAKNAQVIKAGKGCAIWDGKQCRKAKLDGDKCVSGGSVIPLALIVASGISFIAFIVFLFLK